MVYPGDCPTRAKFFLFNNLLITEDLPTFDFPENTIVGRLPYIKSLGEAADFINSALFMFIFRYLLPQI